MTLVFGVIGRFKCILWRWSGSWLGKYTLGLLKSPRIHKMLSDWKFLYGIWLLRPWALYNRCPKFSFLKRSRVVKCEFLCIFLFDFFRLVRCVRNPVHRYTSWWISSALGASFRLFGSPSCRSKVGIAKFDSLFNHCLLGFIFLNLLLSLIGSTGTDFTWTPPSFERSRSRWFTIGWSFGLPVLVAAILTHLGGRLLRLLHINVTYSLSSLLLQ